MLTHPGSTAPHSSARSAGTSTARADAQVTGEAKREAKREATGTANEGGGDQTPGSQGLPGSDAAPLTPPVGPDGDTKPYRKALGAFATGVTIVTTLGPQSDAADAADGTVETGRTPRGFTANSFTSVSLDPPIILFCQSRTSQSYPFFAGASHFAINILAAEQEDAAMVFASGDGDRFSKVDWHAGPFGLPLISGAAAQLICAKHDEVSGGDHAVIFGRVLSFARQDGPSLGYTAGQFFSAPPGNH